MKRSADHVQQLLDIVLVSILSVDIKICSILAPVIQCGGKRQGRVHGRLGRPDLQPHVALEEVERRGGGHQLHRQKGEEGGAVSGCSEGQHVG